MCAVAFESDCEMDSLQTLACHSFLVHSIVGTETPHDTPGALRLWVGAWAKCVGLDNKADVLQMLHECIERGSSSVDIRHATSRCDGDKASQFNDMTISMLLGWTWRIKNFALIRQRIRAEEQKEAESQRRYRVVKNEVVETLGDIRRCEDSQKYMLQIRQRLSTSRGGCGRSVLRD